MTCNNEAYSLMIMCMVLLLLDLQVQVLEVTLESNLVLELTLAFVHVNNRVLELFTV
jgi:hypothetical protein